MIIRDTTAIKSVGVYFKKASEELLEIKNKLEKSINKITDCYQSAEADVIKDKLLSNINDLSNYIENLNYYSNTFITSAENDKEVSLKTKNNLVSIGDSNE